MSKFWQKKYISKYTGAEIDAAVAKADATVGLPEGESGNILVHGAEEWESITYNGSFSSRKSTLIPETFTDQSNSVGVIYSANADTSKNRLEYATTSRLTSTECPYSVFIADTGEIPRLFADKTFPFTRIITFDSATMTTLIAGLSALLPTVISTGTGQYTHTFTSPALTTIIQDYINFENDKSISYASGSEWIAPNQKIRLFGIDMPFIILADANFGRLISYKGAVLYASGNYIECDFIFKASDDTQAATIDCVINMRKI